MPRTRKTSVARLSLSPLLKFKAACASIGVPYGSGRDAHFRGELSIVKIGRAWYVTEDELARFVERNTKGMAG